MWVEPYIGINNFDLLIKENFQWLRSRYNTATNPQAQYVKCF